MHTDVVYEALHPFHLWAWIAAVCAFALAATACAVLALSRRFSLRWWLGMGIITVCLLTIAFGARSRATAYRFRPTTRGCVTPDCGVMTPNVVAAQQQVTFLGIVILVATALSLAAAAWVLFLRRHPGVRLRLPANALPIAVAIVVAGCGGFLTTNGIADWIDFAYLADITRAGDSLGQIPLAEAIMATIFGVLVLAAGLGVLIASSTPRRNSANTEPSYNCYLLIFMLVERGARASSAIYASFASTETRFFSICQAFSLRSA